MANQRGPETAERDGIAGVARVGLGDWFATTSGQGQ